MAFINTPDLRTLQDVVMRAQSALRHNANEDEIAQARLDLVKAQAILTSSSDGIADAGLREAANDEYAMGSDNNIEIDDEPATSEANDGVWVAAWVWMARPPEDEEEEDDDGE